jgi:hypothetical protein
LALQFGGQFRPAAPNGDACGWPRSAPPAPEQSCVSKIDLDINIHVRKRRRPTWPDGQITLVLFTI